MSIASRIACLISCLGTAAISILICLVYFEGVPILKTVPLIGHVPIVGAIAEGEIARRIAVKLEGYVTLSENAALKAQFEKAMRDRQSAERVSEEYRKREAASAAIREEHNATLDKTIADDKAADTAAGAGAAGSVDGYWSAGELDWLSKH